ncbi:MAG: hypothetical protein NTX25_24110 [Proteobacteria bacterium]|nr:hypothetical protein [Pseudomonadota bacterium]
MRFFTLIIFSLFFSACAHSVHQVYISSMDAKATQGKWISADAKAFVVLGFQFNTDYVEAAYKELEGKCPGRLAQVTTEHLSSYYFLSYDQKVILKGLCMQG